MEPLSLVGTCFHLSKIIYSNIKRCTDVGDTLDALTQDQRDLRKAIEGFQSQIPLGESIHPQWITLGSSLTGLASTMKELEGILWEIRHVQLGVATRPVQVIRLQMQNDQIDELKRKIEISSMRRIEANTSDLSAKLDKTIFLISQFLQLLPVSQPTADANPPDNATPRLKIDIENWTTLAGQLVSTSETLETPATADNRISKFDPEVQLDEVQSFFQEAWNDQEEAYLRELKQLPRHTRGDPKDDPDHRFLHFLRQRASEAFEAKNYKAARVSLKRLLERSPKVYGPYFEGRDEVLRMLVICCVRLEDWEEADQYMVIQFQGRDQTMEDLAMDFYLRGKRDEASKICLGGERGKKFVGREAVMDLVAASYIRDKRWAEAKKILSDLLFTEQPEPYIRLQRLHEITQVHFALRDYDSAKSCGEVVLNERRMRLGEEHILYYQSAALLGQICEKNGDSLEAEYYKTLSDSDAHTIAEINELCSLAGQAVLASTPPKPARKKSITARFLKSNSGDDDSINNAVNALGKTILKDCFRPDGLKLMKKTMKKNNCIVGPGDGYSLLHAFAKRGRTTVVEHILDKGADPNARDNFNLTPLLRAVMEGHVEMARLLIRKGADIEATYEGNTPLIEATLQKNNELVKLLIEHGAYMEAKTKDGHTAIHVAATNAYVKIVQTLFKAGAEINTRDQKQMTPLMSAALSNKYWMVELLLTMGADVEAMDRDGETALQLHQNKAAARILALTQLHDMRTTPVARLLQWEMARQRRMARRTAEIVVNSPKLEINFGSDNLSSDVELQRSSV